MDEEEINQAAPEAEVAAAEPVVQAVPAPINPPPVVEQVAAHRARRYNWDDWQQAEDDLIFNDLDLERDFERNRINRNREYDRLLEEQQRIINQNRRGIANAYHERMRQFQVEPIRNPLEPQRREQDAWINNYFNILMQPIPAPPAAVPVPVVPAAPAIQAVNMLDAFQMVVQRIGEQNRAPGFNQPVEEPEPRRDMNYDQLVRRYAVLADRYFPDLSNRDNAFSALQTIDSDPIATDVEKAALREYVGAHTNASNYTYRWCAECQSMVGFESHSHCPYCTYPAIPASGNDAVKSYELSACGFCGECCRLGDGNRRAPHYHCPTCNVHQERLCRHCTKCSSGCCACILCPTVGCQEMQECEDCHSCLDHCSCVLAKANGPFGKMFPAFKKTERKQFDCNRLAGIEWEYNQLGTNRYIDHWCRRWLSDLHRDDSCGYEAVTAPVAGDYMVKCVDSLGKVFSKSRARIDNRCSIHTHVDAKDLQWADMFRFLSLYSKVEPILYLIAGQERLSNRYAVPIGKEYGAALERVDRKDAIMAVAFTTLTREGRKSEVNLAPDNGRNSQREKPGRRADNHAYCRRKGLNILPWLAGRGPRPRTPVNVPILNGDTLEKIAQRNGVSVAALMRWNKIKQGAKLVFGRNLIVNKRTIAPDTTVEFRIHPNTTDSDRVINWVKLMVRLVDWAAKSTDKDLENLPKSPLRILCQNVAPDIAPWIMSRVKEWRRETPRKNGRAQRLISLKGGKYVY